MSDSPDQTRVLAVERCFCWLRYLPLLPLEALMNKLILPVAIFVSVIIAGKIAEHYEVQGSWKIGVLCVVAAAVQIAVTRYQRSRQ